MKILMQALLVFISVSLVSSLPVMAGHSCAGAAHSEKKEKRETSISEIQARLGSVNVGNEQEYIGLFVGRYRQLSNSAPDVILPDLVVQADPIVLNGEIDLDLTVGPPKAPSYSTFGPPKREAFPVSKMTRVVKDGAAIVTRVGVSSWSPLIIPNKGMHGIVRNRLTTVRKVTSNGFGISVSIQEIDKSWVAGVFFPQRYESLIELTLLPDGELVFKYRSGENISFVALYEPILD